MCAGSEQSDVDHLACATDSTHTKLDVAYAAAVTFSTLLRKDPTLPPPCDPADPSDTIADVMDGLQWPICNCAVRSCRWSGETERELRQHVLSTHSNCAPASWTLAWDQLAIDPDVGTVCPAELDDCADWKYGASIARQFRFVLARACHPLACHETAEPYGACDKLRMTRVSRR